MENFRRNSSKVAILSDSDMVRPYAYSFSVHINPIAMSPQSDGKLMHSLEKYVQLL